MESRDMECWRGDKISTKALLTPPYSLLPHGLARPSSLPLLTPPFPTPCCCLFCCRPLLPASIPLSHFLLLLLPPLVRLLCLPPSSIVVGPVMILVLWPYSPLWLDCFYSLNLLLLLLLQVALLLPLVISSLFYWNTKSLLPNCYNRYPYNSSLLLLLVPPSSCCGAPQTSGRHKVTSTIRDVLNSPSHQYK